MLGIYHGFFGLYKEKYPKSRRFILYLMVQGGS